MERTSPRGSFTSPTEFSHSSSSESLLLMTSRLGSRAVRPSAFVRLHHAHEMLMHHPLTDSSSSSRVRVHRWNFPILSSCWSCNPFTGDLKRSTTLSLEKQREEEEEEMEQNESALDRGILLVTIRTPLHSLPCGCIQLLFAVYKEWKRVEPHFLHCPQTTTRAPPRSLQLLKSEGGDPDDAKERTRTHSHIASDSADLFPSPSLFLMSIPPPRRTFTLWST